MLLETQKLHHFPHYKSNITPRAVIASICIFDPQPRVTSPPNNHNLVDETTLNYPYIGQSQEQLFQQTQELLCRPKRPRKHIQKHLPRNDPLHLLLPHPHRNLYIS
jgi:hypothetical protein